MSNITRDYSFGGWLRAFRLEAQLTLREASARIGGHAGNLSKLETSGFDPPRSREKIKKMLQVYGKEDSLDFMCSLAFQHHLAKLKEEFK